jgi:transposase
MKPKPRINTPNRAQLILDVIDYDELIPENHPARIIVSFVEKLDLEAFYAEIKAIEGSAGRTAFDPRLLLCIWLYATVEGIGSARLIEQLCGRDCAFRWICGGLKINYHTLSDFRTANTERLDQLLTDIVTSFVSANIVKLKSIAIDGTKISASASLQSFKKRSQLHKLKKEVKHRVAALRQELEQNTHASINRVETARNQSILNRERKINKALSELPKIEAVKEIAKKKVKKGTKVSEAKVSTTDPEARIMRFSDGSIDAGYNCQVALDPESYMVLSVDVTNQGNDRNLLKPIVENIESRYETTVERALVDTGYPTHQDIIDLAEKKNPTLIYSPLKKKKAIKTASLRKREKKEANFPEPVKAFFKRMGNEISNKYYKLRSRIETVNGIVHNRMPTGFHLRGKVKAKSELLLQAIGHNIMRGFRLRAIS